MKHQNKPMFISCFLFLNVVVFTHLSISLTAQEVEDERDFDYIEGSNKGPAHWGDIKKEWATCKNGSMQSRIDISILGKIIIFPRLGELKRTYKPSNATLKNRGHDIKVSNPPPPPPKKETRYAMELHMVYQSWDPKTRNNNIAVVGVFYLIGVADAFLSKLTRDVSSMSDQKTERSIGVIDPAEITKLRLDNYYRYMGSLTIPPCSEAVIWIINKRFGTVSKEQIHLLRQGVRAYAEMNVRPVQPLNGRKIQA